MTEKKRYTYLNASRNSFIGSFFCNDIPLTNQEVVELLKENEQLKLRLKEERELVMKISRECDALIIKKQELELEIIRLEKIIKTGDGDDCNRTS